MCTHECTCPHLLMCEGIRYDGQNDWGWEVCGLSKVKNIYVMRGSYGGDSTCPSYSCWSEEGSYDVYPSVGRM